MAFFRLCREGGGGLPVLGRFPPLPVARRLLQGDAAPLSNIDAVRFRVRTDRLAVGAPLVGCGLSGRCGALLRLSAPPGRPCAALAGPSSAVLLRLYRGRVEVCSMGLLRPWAGLSLATVGRARSEEH